MRSSQLILGSLIIGLSTAVNAVNWGWLEHTPAQSFTEQDWVLFRQNVRSALDTLADEESSEWQNPDSGNSGSVTILGTTSDDQGYCRTVEISNHTKTQSGKNKNSLCRQPDGSWKIKK